ncbi:hypothetical protein ROZALSC1DRAFT_21668, partial [Rozella allomycis CSF55]
HWSSFKDPLVKSFIHSNYFHLNLQINPINASLFLKELNGLELAWLSLYLADHSDLQTRNDIILYVQSNFLHHPLISNRLLFYSDKSQIKNSLIQMFYNCFLDSEISQIDSEIDSDISKIDPKKIELIIDSLLRKYPIETFKLEMILNDAIQETDKLNLFNTLFLQSINQISINIEDTKIYSLNNYQLANDLLNVAIPFISSTLIESALRKFLVQFPLMKELYFKLYSLNQNFSLGSGLFYFHNDEEFWLQFIENCVIDCNDSTIQDIIDGLFYSAKDSILKYSFKVYSMFERYLKDKNELHLIGHDLDWSN